MIAQVITGLAAGAAYALMAVGVVLIFKGTRALSVANGEIGAFGFFFGLRWADRGMPGHRIGRLWKFKLSEVDAWARTKPETE